MSTIIEVCIPKYPECWTSCGNCGSGEVSVDDVRVLPGETVARDDTLIVLETGKVAIDIPAPNAGTIVELFVAAGDLVGEGQLVATLEIG